MDLWVVALTHFKGLKINSSRNIMNKLFRSLPRAPSSARIPFLGALTLRRFLGVPPFVSVVIFWLLLAFSSSPSVYLRHHHCPINCLRHYPLPETCFYDLLVFWCYYYHGCCYCSRRNCFWYCERTQAYAHTFVVRVRFQFVGQVARIARRNRSVGFWHSLLPLLDTLCCFLRCCALWR